MLITFFKRLLVAHCAGHVTELQATRQKQRKQLIKKLIRIGSLVSLLQKLQQRVKIKINAAFNRIICQVCKSMLIYFFKFR